jgi:ketosteroid isomerase-like protein
MNTNQVAKIEKMCRSYVTSMESGDLKALLANFTEDATATSPIFGRQPARDFYSYVLREISGRSMVLRTIFVGASDPARAAIHVAYTRTVGSGKPATIEGVDVFELTEDRSKFPTVTIIYDSAPVRSDFDKWESGRS